MSASECPEDLLVRERRGGLGPVERRALAQHAATCELCSLSRAIGRGIGAAAAEETGDETDGETGNQASNQAGNQGGNDDQARLALIVARTMLMRGKVVRNGNSARADSPAAPAPSSADVDVAPRAMPRRRRGASSPRRFAVAAALLLLAGSASAALWRWSAWTTLQTRIQERAASTGARTAGSRRRAASAVAPAPAPAEEAPAIGEPPPVEPPPVPLPESAVAPSPAPAVRAVPSLVAPPPSRAPVRTVAAARRAAVELDARQLFVAAGQARRAGDFVAAARIYRELQARYPGSPEATLSFLSLGDLSLSQGRPSQALVQFDAYLASGDTMMAEEALVGRARVLARLGRTEDERAAWRALLSRFPQSDYRWRAQQRLDRAGDAP